MDSFEDQLLKNEYVVYQCQPHWVIFSWPVGLFLFAALILSIVPFLHIIAYALVVVGVFATAVSAISYHYTEYTITNKRFIRRIGFVSRSTSGLMLKRVEGVDAIQSITGRILGFGNVLITGTGGTQEVIINIPNPFEFRRKLQQAIQIVEDNQ